MLNVLAITQARTSSSRLPGKVLKKVGEQSLLEIHLKRLSKSKLVSKVMVATSTEEGDQSIVDVCNQLGIKSYRGSLKNVLDRFYQAALPQQTQYVVRVTSDCPLIDPQLIDQVIQCLLDSGADYCSNTLNPGFPNGQDVEVFKFSVLERAWKEANTDYDKEHVTPYIYRNSDFLGGTLFHAVAQNAESQKYADVRITVDTADDFEVIKLLIEKLGADTDWKTYADYYLNENSSTTTKP